MTEYKAIAGYTVVLELDGTISTQPFPADENFQRQASTIDIYNSAKDLTTNVESYLLAERVANMVIGALQPPTPTAEMAEKIKEALSDRGIETPVVE
jgi:hypothetical protein